MYVYATTLGEAFNPKATGAELLAKLGPVGVAVTAIFVAVFLFTVGLWFFRRHAASVALFREARDAHYDKIMAGGDYVDRGSHSEDEDVW
jgi:hypothetical protein